MRRGVMPYEEQTLTALEDYNELGFLCVNCDGFVNNNPTCD